MRRFLLPALVALAFLLTSPARPAAAALKSTSKSTAKSTSKSTSKSTATAAATSTGRIVCTVTDNRVQGLSGLIVTDSGYISISDSNPDKSAIRVWFFDKKCQVTRSISYPTSAYDPEDVALGRDGTIYVADIGDNNRTRSSIAVWRIAPGSSTPHLYRYRYPDHPHDAEAMLLAADDTPIFITKDIGTGEIYVPTKPGDPSGKPVPLKRVGAFNPTVSDTPNFLGVIGSALVTGGANAHGRSMVALRTYADAYVWEVRAGDVVKTITTTKPRVIPLPNEPQGESIAFDPSGTHLYTVSDREVHPVKTPILEYALPPAPVVRATATATATPTTKSSVAAKPTNSKPTNSKPTSSKPYSIVVFVIAGLAILAAAVSVLYVVRRRRRPG